jgi:DNA-binding SARP family transcriptional activator
MARLDLIFLGPWQTALADGAIEQPESNKVRAMLAVLAVEHTQPHPRDSLAELFWPGHSLEAARGNFRRALANLRSVLGDRAAHPPYLLITRETVQFNLASDVFVDVVRFRELVKTPPTHPAWVEHLEQAATLYRGSFLEGFHLDGCPEFELWTTSVRSELEQLAAGALSQLARHYHAQAGVERALPLYRRCLALNPYDEAALRGLMLALTTTGQRGAALAHYAAFRRELHEELDAQPEAQTADLFSAIQQGRYAGAEAVSLTVPGPAVSVWPGPGTQAAAPFVGREKELAALHDCARPAAQGRGQIVFILGEAGSGKSSLLDEFARQLSHTHPPWLVAHGNCTALLGIGDLYQPLVDGLRMVTAGEPVTSNTHLARQPHPAEAPFANTEAARLLREIAPDWARLALAGVAQPANVQQAGSQPLPPTAPAPRAAPQGNRNDQTLQPPQAALFDQLARFFERLTWNRPLLLALDNLHWADAGTVALLFHLAQRLAHSRIFIAGTYRPGTLALTQAGRIHPLDVVVQALRHQVGAALVDLDQADGRGFVDALLDREPNRLDQRFRQALCSHSEGHALFTVELLHTMVAAGWLSRDQEERWVAGDALDWDVLPPRIEALVRERVDRLAPADRRLLDAACVQGDVFRAEIAASVLGLDERAVVERLSGDLTAGHRLVLPGGAATSSRARPGAAYRFRHHLFCAYLYGALDVVQRSRLHRAVAVELDRLYQEHPAATGISPQELAWHCQRGGEPGKAVDYLRTASQRALAWHAYAEAAGYLTQALALAPPEDHGLRFELAAAREQATGLLGDHQARLRDVAELERLAALSQDPRHRLVAALRRATLAQETAHYAEAITAASTALALAAAAHDRLAELEGRRVAGRAHWQRGDLVLACRHYAYALRRARVLPDQHAVADCLLHRGVACWSLDDLAGAEAAFAEAQGIAVALDAPFLRAAASMGLGMAAWARGDYQQAEGRLDAALEIARELRLSWLEGQVLLNQLALCRLSASYDRALALHVQLVQHCQAIDDRWTVAAAQIEAAALFVQLGAWMHARGIAEAAAVAVDALHALWLKVRLLHLQARLHLAAGDPAYAGAAIEALPIAVKLGVPSLLAESWLLQGLMQQRQGEFTEAAAALGKARMAAQGAAAHRLLPEIVAAQAQLAMAMGDAGFALACVEELLAGNPLPLVERAADPASLYLICHAVLAAASEPWAEQMLVRGSRLLHEHAALIPDSELQRSFCEEIPSHWELMTLCS